MLTNSDCVRLHNHLLMHINQLERPERQGSGRMPKKVKGVEKVQRGRRSLIWHRLRLKVSQRANQAQKKQEAKVEIQQMVTDKVKEADSLGKWREIPVMELQTEIQQPLFNNTSGGACFNMELHIDQSACAIPCQELSTISR